MFPFFSLLDPFFSTTSHCPPPGMHRFPPISLFPSVTRPAKAGERRPCSGFSERLPERGGGVVVGVGVCSGSKDLSGVVAVGVGGEKSKKTVGDRRRS